VIRLVVLMYVRFSQSLRQVEDTLIERSVEQRFFVIGLIAAVSENTHIAKPWAH
jgi:hypothetical protein